MKKIRKFFPEIFEFLCDQNIDAIDLVLQHNIFGVTIKFFSSVAK